VVVVVVVVLVMGVRVVTVSVTAVLAMTFVARMLFPALVAVWIMIMHVPAFVCLFRHLFGPRHRCGRQPAVQAIMRRHRVGDGFPGGPILVPVVGHRAHRMSGENPEYFVITGHCNRLYEKKGKGSGRRPPSRT
jgi:hypothetical protein